MEENNKNNDQESERNIDEVSMEIEKEKLRKKKRLKKNIIEFIIGIILLGVAFIYMNNNPAEKTSVVSGLSILYKKAEIFVHSLLSKNGNLLNEKYELEKNYKEIIKAIENSDCKLKKDIGKIQNNYKKLKQMPVDDFKGQRKYFRSFAGEYFDKVKEKCR